MAFDGLVRNAIALANSLTRNGGLQEEVSIERYNGEDSYGKPTYAAAIEREGIVVHSSRRVRLDSGEETISTAQVSFLEDIPAVSPVVAGREEPIDNRDKITLANGKTGPILQKSGGLTDPTTGRPYALTVFLG